MNVFSRARTAGTTVLVVAVLSLLPTPALARSYAGLVLDAATGETLYEDRADEARFPASLTKMMTLRLAFDAMERGALSPDDRVTFSARAAAAPPSKVGVAKGGSIRVDEAVRALIVKSANDVAVALCETMYGTEERCAWAMTLEARRLGMTSTTFRNASGLPDRDQVTTARDMARLGLSLKRDHPDRFDLFRTRSVTVAGKTFKTHNRLLGSVSGVDGIKTGYTRASGFNLVTTLERDGRSIVAVVIGGRTGASRDVHMRDLIGRTLRKASRTGGIVASVPNPSVPSPGTPVGVAVADLDPTTVGPVDERPYRDTAALAYAPTEGRASGSDAAEAITTALVADTPAPAPDERPTTVERDADGRWMVQVAAAPTERGARSMLSRAVDLHSGFAAQAERVVTGEKDGKTFHQARFVGYDTARAAARACSALKSAGGDCYHGRS